MTPRARTTWIVGALSGVVVILSLVAAWPTFRRLYYENVLAGDPGRLAEFFLAEHDSPRRQAAERFVFTSTGKDALLLAYIEAVCRASAFASQRWASFESGNVTQCLFVWSIDDELISRDASFDGSSGSFDSVQVGAARDSVEDAALFHVLQDSLASVGYWNHPFPTNESILVQVVPKEDLTVGWLRMGGDLAWSDYVFAAICDAESPARSDLSSDPRITP